MRKLPFNAPVFRQAPAAQTQESQTAARRAPMSAPRELKLEELSQVSGGAPGFRWTKVR